MNRKRIFIFFFIILVVVAASGTAFSMRYPLCYEQHIATYCQMYQLDPALVASIINEESSFNPSAQSSRGAMGLMQLMPQTAKYVCTLLGEDFEKANLFDPQTNIKLGCCYLNYLGKKFFSQTEILCAYNAGEHTVSLWLANQGVSSDGKNLSRIPYSQTHIYVKKIQKGIKIYDFLLKNRAFFG